MKFIVKRGFFFIALSMIQMFYKTLSSNKLEDNVNNEHFKNTGISTGIVYKVTFY